MCTQRCSQQFQELVSATDTFAEAELHVAARSHELCGEFVRRVEGRVPNFLSDETFEKLTGQVCQLVPCGCFSGPL